MASTRAWKLCVNLVAALGLALLFAAVSAVGASALSFEARTLNGSENNKKNPTWGESGQPFPRVAPAHYADGISEMESGPNARYISNRIFNALQQDVFDPHNVSQWGWIWGQFVDHNVDLAEGGTEKANITTNPSDPLEEFTNTLGYMPFTRLAAAPGTGTSTSNPRTGVNTEQSYLDADNVYGDEQSRDEWLRTGPDNGNPAEAGAELMLPGGYLPLESARGNASTAPFMKTEGALESEPQNAEEAGDPRANENSELTAVQTLFAREHNRIVSELPSSLSAEEKFQIARRVVGAEVQFITYEDFLPAMGLKLPVYPGYNAKTNATIADEFDVVGFRGHSMVDGEEEIEVPESTYTQEQIETLEKDAIEVTKVTLSNGKPGLHLLLTQPGAFFNPKVVKQIGEGVMLEGMSQMPDYRNDEMLDDSVRSALFQIPDSPTVSAAECFANPETPTCFQAVLDLGAIDVQRGRDAGMPTYSELRKAYGLKEKKTFDEVTGEKTEAFPSGDTIESPACLKFPKLENFFHEEVPFNSAPPVRATYDTRTCTVSARLKAIYGEVKKMDAFVGMLAEGTDSSNNVAQLPELQAAIWKKQFENLRNGDRFFYLNDPELVTIALKYGITYRHTLGELEELNAGVKKGEIPNNVFEAPTPAKANGTKPLTSSSTE